MKDIDKLQIKMNICQELSVFKSYKSWYHAAEMLFDINAQCEFLAEKLGVSFKNEVKVAPLGNGINFLGYVQHIFYRLVRRRVVNNFRNKLRELEKSFCRSARGPRAELIAGEPPALPEELPKLRSVLTSYLAYSSKANSFRIVLKTLYPHQWLKQFFKLYRTKASFVEDITFEHKVLLPTFF